MINIFFILFYIFLSSPSNKDLSEEQKFYLYYHFLDRPAQDLASENVEKGKISQEFEQNSNQIRPKESIENVSFISKYALVQIYIIFIFFIEFFKNALLFHYKFLENMIS